MKPKRRDGELPEDYAERVRLHQRASLPKAERERILRRELQREDHGASSGEAHIDRSRTALDSAPGSDFADVHVLASPEDTRPDLLLIATEEGQPSSRLALAAAREHPLTEAERAAVLGVLMDWIFDRGGWEHAADITGRIYSLAWAAFPDLLAYYCDASTRALTAAPSRRACALRRNFFSTAAVKQRGWNFRTSRPRLNIAPDIAAVCQLGLGDLLPHLDTVRQLLSLWFQGSPARYSADPALVTRRALATAYTTHPALVRGMFMEELAKCTGQVKQTFQWMVDKMFKSRGIAPITCRGEGDYAGGQHRAKQRQLQESLTEQ